MTIAIIDAVTVQGSVLITAARGTSLVASKACMARVVMAKLIMGCCLLTGARVVWADFPVFFPRMTEMATLFLVLAVIVATAFIALTVVALAAVLTTAAVLLVLFDALLLHGGKDLCLDDLFALVTTGIVFGDGAFGAVAFLDSKLIVLTHPCNSGVNPGGYFRHVLLVAVHGKVILATTTKTTATLDLPLGMAGQVLLVGLLGPAKV
jgi:hypothetical protein